MTAGIYEYLNSQKPAILAKWQAVILPRYSGLPQKKTAGPFTSPGTYIVRKNTELILNGLLNASGSEDCLEPLQEICRLKAVEEVSPGEALGFIFALKEIIGDELPPGTGKNEVTILRALDKRIDDMALRAFDYYADCRARIYQMKLDELKRMYGRGAG